MANLVDYVLYDVKKIERGHGKGHTINLSQTGMLLQTETEIKGAFIVLMAMDVGGNIIKINGRLVSSRICDETGCYLNGIKFVGEPDQQIKALIGPAATTEKRRNPRVDVDSPVDYVLYDVKQVKTGYGKGRTINLSQTGMLLQTRDEIKGAFIVLMAMDVDGTKIKINGRVVTSRICEETGSYLNGIQFVGEKDKQIQAIIAFIKAYQKKKYRTQIGSRKL